MSQTLSIGDVSQVQRTAIAQAVASIREYQTPTFNAFTQRMANAPTIEELNAVMNGWLELAMCGDREALNKMYSRVQAGEVWAEYRPVVYKLMIKYLEGELEHDTD
jgi:hypothetical protein